jgi:hypothetical protein
MRFQADSLLFLTEQGAARWTARGQSVGPRGQSAGSWRTVRPAQRSVLPAVDFAILPLEFKRGQSARASRTVREVRVLPITASNGKGEYILQARGWRASLATLKGLYSLVELSLSSLSLTWLSGFILCEIESF